MKILLDECVTKHPRSHLSDHEVFTVSQMKWNGLRNGNLISQAIEQKFDLLLTIDKNLQFQQDIAKRNIILVVFNSVSSKIEFLVKFLPQFSEQLSGFKKGNSYLIESV